MHMLTGHCFAGYGRENQQGRRRDGKELWGGEGDGGSREDEERSRDHGGGRRREFQGKF